MDNKLMTFENAAFGKIRTLTIDGEPWFIINPEYNVYSETDDPLSQTRYIIELLRDSPDFLEHYDEELFSELIENVIVKNRTDVRFRLKNGLELDEHIGRTLS